MSCQSKYQLEVSFSKADCKALWSKALFHFSVSFTKHMREVFNLPSYCKCFGELNMQMDYCFFIWLLLFLQRDLLMIDFLRLLFVERICYKSASSFGFKVLHEQKDYYYYCECPVPVFTRILAVWIWSILSLLWHCLCLHISEVGIIVLYFTGNSSVCLKEFRSWAQEWDHR